MSYKIGLTGGIGSGKSTVAAAFADLGIPVFSADEIGHRLCARGQPGFERIVAEFGQGILGPEGELDRAALGDRVFHDPGSRKHLESILHPLILGEMQQHADSVETPYCVLDIPLLIGTAEVERVDRILVVDCARDTRIQRIKARNGWSEQKIRQVMDNQASDEELRTAADDILDNNGATEAIAPQVGDLHRKYLRLSKESL